MATVPETDFEEIRAAVQSVVLDVLRRRAAGEPLSDDEVIASRPELAEVHQVRPAFAVDENVGRLEVAVNDAAIVGMLQRFGNGDANLRGLTHRRLLPAHFELVERLGIGGFGTVEKLVAFEETCRLRGKR
jgi:hypothetical protein